MEIMTHNIFWDDIEEGLEFPHVIISPTKGQYIKWWREPGKYYRQPYNELLLVERETSDEMVSGRLLASMIVQFLKSWVGDEAALKQISCVFQDLKIRDYTLLFKGRIRHKYVENKQYCVDCEIWVENIIGETTGPGLAILTFPRRRLQTQL
jgi:hypothetical protein